MMMNSIYNASVSVLRSLRLVPQQQRNPSESDHTANESDHTANESDHTNKETDQTIIPPKCLAGDRTQLNNKNFDSVGAPISLDSSSPPTFHTSASWVNTAPGRMIHDDPSSEHEEDLDPEKIKSRFHFSHPKSNRPYKPSDRFKPGPNRPAGAGKGPITPPRGGNKSQTPQGIPAGDAQIQIDQLMAHIQQIETQKDALIRQTQAQAEQMQKMNSNQSDLQTQKDALAEQMQKMNSQQSEQALKYSDLQNKFSQLQGDHSQIAQEIEENSKQVEYIQHLESQMAQIISDREAIAQAFEEQQQQYAQEYQKQKSEHADQLKQQAQQFAEIQNKVAKIQGEFNLLNSQKHETMAPLSPMSIYTSINTSTPVSTHSKVPICGNASKTTSAGLTYSLGRPIMSSSARVNDHQVQFSSENTTIPPPDHQTLSKTQGPVGDHQNSVGPPTGHSEQAANTSNEVLLGIADLLKTVKPKNHNQKVQEFDGLDQDIDDYIASFKVIKSWNGWSDDQSAQQLVMALRGSAKEAWNTKCNGHIPSFDELIQILRDRFQPEGYRELHRAEFQNRRKRSDESYLEYSHTLKKLATKSHKEYPENLRNDIIKDQIVRNLEHEEAIFLKARNAVKLDDVVTALTEYDNTKKCEKAPFAPKPRPVANISQAGEEQASNLVLDLLQMISKNSQKPEAEKKPSNRFPRDVATKRCWRCKEMGHIQWQCPKFLEAVDAGLVTPPPWWTHPAKTQNSNNMPRPLLSQVGNNSAGYRTQNQQQGSLDPNTTAFNPGQWNSSPFCTTTEATALPLQTESDGA